MAKQQQHDYMASIDDTKTEEAQKAAESSGIFRDWKTGANILRILPPVANTKWARGLVLCPVWQYWRLPPSDNMARDIRRTFGDGPDDPIADCLAELREQGVDTSKLESLSSPSFYANVIDLKENEPRVQVQKFPKGLAQWIFGQLADDDLAGKAVLNPYSGSALAVKYDPDNKDNRSKYVPSWPPGRVNQPIAQGDGEVEALMAGCQDLAEIFTPPAGEDLIEIADIARELFEYAAPAPDGASVAAPNGGQGDQGAIDDLPF